jgi:hypothetical protein
MIDGALFVGHGDCVLNCLGEFLCIPGIDNDTPIQRLRRPREFTQYHHPVTFLLRANVLVRNLPSAPTQKQDKVLGVLGAGGRYEIHSVSGGANETDVADVVEGNEFGKVNRLMHKMNRDKLDAAELSVDTTNEFIYRCPEILVLLHISPRRHGNLNQHHLYRKAPVQKEGIFFTLPRHSGCLVRKTSKACNF